ncbi:MAG TPA: ABC transporter permease [Treponema sp.]|nr:ABC transporter permease [Treponema sp.]HRS03097.1 ABC transporter permease [Treponema sp.]HRU27891.1 ABC transporter permease [Treponema sp.]
MRLIGAIGHKVINRTQQYFYALGFLGRLLRETALFFTRRQVALKVLVMQILFTGVEALSISTVLAIGIGAIINIIGVSVLPQFGQGKLMYTLLIAIITRELGPLLTAFIITARSGTAIATELGNMVVSHEIEAYISVGIDPISYLAVPRFLGVTLSSLFLNIYFNIFGLLGSYVVLSLVAPLPFTEYFNNLMEAIRLVDIGTGLFKSIIFGALVSTVAVFQGFSVLRASTEIPQAGIRAVGQSLVLLVVADAFITVLSYLI